MKHNIADIIIIYKGHFPNFFIGFSFNLSTSSKWEFIFILFLLSNLIKSATSSFKHIKFCLKEEKIYKRNIYIIFFIINIIRIIIFQ